MKITYILSKIDKSIAFEWIYEAMQKEYDFSFIFIGEQQGHLFHWLKERGVAVYFIPYSGKKSLLAAFFQLLRLLRLIQPKIVHTHLFEANLIGLTAAKLLGIPKRIYTRHHSTYHHEYFPHAVKWDRWCNTMATAIIAITKSVRSVLIVKEKVKAEKVHLIEHGFKLTPFDHVDQIKTNTLIEKYQIPKNKMVIGAISRYIELKGVLYIIRAFKQLLKKHPELHLILANAQGPDADLIRRELEGLPKSSYTEIKFEADLFTLYQLFDVFVHLPINREIEAFGQTYVEALAAGVPSVFTLSGIANDFIVDRENALVVDYKNKDQTALAVEELLHNKTLTDSLIKNGKAAVKQFSLEKMIVKLDNLYHS